MPSLQLNQAGAPDLSPLPNTYHSPWFDQIVTMVRAGIDERVLCSYINSAGTFNLDSDQIIYLRDLGVSSQVISRMIRHDLEFAAGMLPSAAPTAPLPPSTFHLLLASPSALAAASAPSATVSAPTSAPGLAPTLVSSELPALIPEATGPGASEMLLASAGQIGLEPPRPPTTPPVASAMKVYPVREPYPVKLVDPILFFPGEDPAANVVIIDMFK
jgi:hypothetical protein